MYKHFIYIPNVVLHSLLLLHRKLDEYIATSLFYISETTKACHYVVEQFVVPERHSCNIMSFLFIRLYHLTDQPGLGHNKESDYIAWEKVCYVVI